MHNHQTQWITQWGGICQGRHDSLIPDSCFADAVNYCLNPDGSLGPRPGIEDFITCPDNKKPIKTYSVDIDGVSLLLIATCKHVYKYNSNGTLATFNKNGTTVNYMYEWPTESNRVSFALLNPNTDKPLLVMGNGKDNMAVWTNNGNVAAEMNGELYGSSPKGLPVEYKNYLAVFGIESSPGIVQFTVNNGIIKSDTESVTDYIIQKVDGAYPLPENYYRDKNGAATGNLNVRDSIDGTARATNTYYIQNGKIYLTGSNTPTFIYIDYTSKTDDPWLYGGIKRYLDLQGEVTALYPYNGLLIFTDHRTELFAGDPDSPTGKTILSNTLGCANYESVCEAEGMCYFIAQQGVCRWDGSGNFPLEIISDENDQRASNISEDIRKINWKARDIFSLTYDPVNRRIYCFIQYYKKNYTKPGATPTYDLFEYEIRNQAWFRWKIAEEVPVNKAIYCNVPSSANSVDMLDGRLLLLASDSNKVYQIKNEMFAETFYDLTHEYEYYVKSGAMTMGTVEHDKIYRAITLQVVPDKKSYEGAKEITFTCFGDMQPTNMKAVFHINFSFVLGGELSTPPVLNASRLGDRLTMLYATEQRRPIAIKCKYFSWQIGGKGNFNALPIYGIGISFRGYSNRSTLTWDDDLV